MKIVTFPETNVLPQNGLLIFLWKETHSENTIMAIVQDFVKKSCNNNGKPWKSSRNFACEEKTLDIFRDFAFCLSFSFIFLHFHRFSLFCTFFFIFPQICSFLFLFHIFHHFRYFFWVSSFFHCFILEKLFPYVFFSFSFLLFFILFIFHICSFFHLFFFPFFFFHVSCFFFFIFSSSFSSFFLFPVVRADAKTRKKSFRSSCRKKGRFSFVKL